MTKNQKKNNKIINLIKFFSRFLDLRSKLKIVLISFLSIINAFFEILGLASLIPLVNYINSKDLYSNRFFLFIEKFYVIEDHNFIIYMFTFFTIIFFISSILIGFLVNYLVFKFHYKFNLNLGKKLVYNYLNNNNSLINQNTSSQIVNKITHETSKLGEIMMATIQFLNQLIILFIISLIILLLESKIFLIIIIVLLFYIFLFKFLKKTIHNFSKKLSISQVRIISLSSQIVMAFKEIRSLGIVETTLDRYTKDKKDFEKIYFINNLISIFPRILIEIIILICFFIFTFYMFLSFDVSIYKTYFYQITFIFIGLVRFNPIVNKLYQNYHIINKFINVIDVFAHDFKKIKKKYQIINSSINKQKVTKITIKNLSFKYQVKGKKILDNINLSINKGEFIGIIGESGSGKSTLANIIANFIQLKNNKSKITFYDENDKKIDTAIYQKKISLLSQKTFLFNESIKKNITLKESKSKKDESLYLNAIKIANLDKLANSRTQKFKGEIFYNFSGGEMQRIAIARAIFKNNDVIIFDESLSSLNKEMQIKIIRNIKKLNKNKIFIMITHDLHLSKYFNKIYYINNGKIFKKNN